RRRGTSGVTGAEATPPIEAAGGVVWRIADDGETEVLVVHRPVHDDWSFPKGKLEPGEAHLDAAVREVEEETGVRGEVGVELPTVAYALGDGRTKAVRWWLMRPVAGEASDDTAPGEVDAARWVRAADASSLLTYDLDRAILRAALD